ncbi:uncharacterized protein F4807DRAFT_447404 [Annulohypoxylon truncatum]|uniref:uncharacterized protein n=1 Tax=Annulohypoxylon truncatum TaxID=327061 RepID=UPI00200798CC|nr:uncharacterized protein F4807DRAFT_447404 [Annulohypoxylon truncatum]KAI1204361.1 hypothetical protein F4807DRAFT_447404 [Annulohypoxylon truncatum]
MAEIPNSDSPDPLSSTPPRPGRLVAPSTTSTVYTTSTPSLPSTPSTNIDLRSSLSESPSRQTRNHQHQRQHQRQTPSNDTSSAPAAIPPPMSFNNHGEERAMLNELLGFIREVDNDELFPFDLPDRELDEEVEEEGLFVSDNDDLDYIDADYDGDGFNAIEGNARPGQPDDLPWVDIPSDDSLEENQFLARMNHQRDAGNNPGQSDELVEMEVTQAGNPRGNQGHQRQQPRAAPEVIDLTGENDSPTQPAQPAPQNHSQNSRRQRSQQRNVLPRLARSDASYMEARNVINLISDSDDEDPAVLPPPRRNEPQRPHQGPAIQQPPRHQRLRDRAQPAPAPARFGLPHPHHTFHDLQEFFNNIPLLRLIGNPPGADNRDRNRGDEDIVMIGHRNLTPNVLPAPNLAPVNLDVRVHPFAVAANAPHAPGGLGAKPAHEPPKETREGFTRNTAEDVVAICPSCELELAYDPDDDDAYQGPPAKKARTKKDKAEHHFWAVKACGHVYCRACYENRKPVGKNPVQVGFRRDPNGPKNHVLCAVEDCETDVSAKSAWVGIFM